jgi:acetolactate decarboxylase
MTHVLLLLTTLAVAAPEVHFKGSLREIIHQGRIEARAPLAAALTKPHAWGLGALARLDGEFVIVDGVVHESRPGDAADIRTTQFDAKADSAALLVWSQVPAWTEIVLARAIPMTALEDTIRSRATGAGLPAEGPFAFTIEGAVTGLRWHVADGRKLPPGPSSHEDHAKAAVKGGAEAAQALLVGFYSDHHQGVFTHHDSGLHMHVWMAETQVAAHVDSVGIAAGAVLRLPLGTARRASRRSPRS